MFVNYQVGGNESMCQAAKPVRSVVLFEGQVKWIMERETPEERLAAWEAISAIAFPNDGETFSPPGLPTDGRKLTPCERTVRDVYNLFKDLIESRAVKTNGKIKDIKKVEAGRQGAAARFGRRGDSSTDIGTGDEDSTPGDMSTTSVSGRDIGSSSKWDVADNEEIEYLAGKGYGRKRRISADEKAAIAEWNKKIPDAKALQQFLKANYMYQNKKLVVTDEFCEFAYHKLARIDCWISTRDGRPFHDIRQAIHYIALDYIKKAGEIRRAEKEEMRKDLELDFEMQTTKNSHQTSSELASIERKRRRAAEREAMEKLMKGEL